MTELAPIEYPVFDMFLLGTVAALSAVAFVFFLRFWRSTRDPLFVAFAVFFAIQAVIHIAVLGLDHPNEGNFWLYLLRLLAVVGIFAAIVWKNIAGG